MSGNRDVSVGDVAIAVEKLGKGRGTPTQPSFKRIDVKVYIYHKDRDRCKIGA